jgi:type I restriction enzyme M protein
MANKLLIDAIWDDSPIDVSTEVNFIWSIANKLRGTYQSDKYKDVIIPMTIIRRFECALEPTKQAVIDQYIANPNFPAKAMFRVSGFQFYNTSEYDLSLLINDSDNLAANFKNYIEGFSSNVQEILLSSEKGLDFIKQIDKMDKNNRLLSVVKAFSELDLNPRTIDNVKMGYIFEELIRKFSENAEAGDHYTGRDIIKLMVNILLAEGCDDIFDDGKVITILDQACGTGGMLSTGYNFIKRYNPSADVRLFGQEINPESYAMCLAEMLIKGQNTESIAYQDTMVEDCFKDTKMRFVLENPPFGTAWGGKDAAEGVEQAVRDEHQKGFDGRWGAGLPGSGDMQMLFLQSAVDKMDDNLGRTAIIQNGSPLFSGGTASGESQIRRWLLTEDLIEAIIALPIDLFYNTGIATYIWVLSKNKRHERKGKVQLIDATSFSQKLRRALGDKKNEISPDDRVAITKLYANFEENEYSKIYPNEEFMYREYAVMQPLQRSYAITIERIDVMLAGGALSALYDDAKVEELENAEELTGKDTKKLETYYNNKPVYEAIINALGEAVSDKVYLSPTEFLPVLTKVLDTATAERKLIDKIADGLSIMDKTAEIQKDKKGNIIFDKETKDIELVKYEEDIEIYMAREVLPHIPDAVAFFDEKIDTKNPTIKVGAEIPFTRYFYKYQQPTPSEELEARFMKLEASVSERVSNLFMTKAVGK